MSQIAKDTIAIILTSSICISFIISSVMFAEEMTRRNADELVKINLSKLEKDTSSKEQACIDGGGMPDYYEGRFSDCKKNN